MWPSEAVKAVDQEFQDIYEMARKQGWLNDITITWLSEKPWDYLVVECLE
jgi:hypothetical protein